MLNKIFDMDNPVMRFLTLLFDLMILNLITVLLCIPVVTAVPALVALHYMTLKMARDEQSYIIAPYFKSFKENFKQAFLLGLILLAGVAVLAVDIHIVWGEGSSSPQAMRIAVTAGTIIIVLLFSWIIPLQSHFVNTIGTTLRNSVLMALGNFPRTLLMAAIWLIPVAIAWASYALWPLIVLFGLSAPAFLCAKVYSPVFRRFEPEPEEETPDEQFSMSEADLEQFSKDLDDTFKDS